ncbi:DMT family transporter [Pseudomonas sp. NPDC090202]|uniref:DMT family transporter n=1 Tax=unclassified Pseudomonas TaxID=196821 RepID=UPI0037F75DFF
MTGNRQLIKGAICGVAAGSCWGVIFLGPVLAPGVSGTGFAVLRFLCYGLFSLILLLPRGRKVWAQLNRTDWVALFWLSLIGNLLYYSLVGIGVQQVGVGTTSLIVGLIPVLVTLAGRRDANAVALSRLLPSLCCASAGVVLISLHAMTGDPAGGDSRVGLLCAFGALISWSWYAVRNARHLALTQVSSHDWALLSGVMTGAQSLLLVLPVFGTQLNSEGLRLLLDPLLVAAGVAALASVIGGALWNQASRLLPLALSGQVLVIETLMALLLGFLWEQRLPTLQESVAIGLLLVGVMWCLRCHQPARTGAVHEHA